jgi:hypothetical protein
MIDPTGSTPTTRSRVTRRFRPRAVPHSDPPVPTAPTSASTSPPRPSKLGGYLIGSKVAFDADDLGAVGLHDPKLVARGVMIDDHDESISPFGRQHG